MRILLDTHILLWSLGETRRLTTETRDMLTDPANELLFSAASIWEISIKRTLGRSDFLWDARVVRRALRDGQYREIPISSEHAAMVAELPPLHKDPFDRMLIAQSLVEGALLLTADERLARYAAPVRVIPRT